MPPKKHCLPLDENGFPVLATNPFCKDGYGWLNEGECGCVPGSPRYDAVRRGCSIRCGGIGPNNCPDCEPPINWLMWGGIGVAALILLAPRRK
jgi:hypothetical protein